MYSSRLVRMDGGLYFDSKVNGQNVKFLIDTGAYVSVISSRILIKILESDRPNLETHTEEIHFADEVPIDTYGYANFKTEIKGITTVHQVWVSGIRGEGLLGINFLKNHGCVIDVDRGIITMDHRHMDRVTNVSETPKVLVKVHDTVGVAPGSEAIVKGRLTEDCQGGEVILSRCWNVGTEWRWLGAMLMHGIKWHP